MFISKGDAENNKMLFSKKNVENIKYNLQSLKEE